MTNFWVARVENLKQFSGYAEHISASLGGRETIERSLIPPAPETTLIAGQCGVCRKQTQFLIDYHYAFEMPDGSRYPNLRERLECQHCHLNTRMRGAMQFLADQAYAKTDSAIYITEQASPMFKALHARYSNVTGSEFLRDGTLSGETNEKGLRHEDATALTFQDEAFDYILSFDVVEHIPDYMAALREMKRCLRVGGSLIMTVPFSLTSTAHIERACIVDGQIQHLMPPEYHGDILDPNGALCFRHYGWKLCEDLKESGFRDAALYFYWSLELGLVGGWPFVIMASR